MVVARDKSLLPRIPTGVELIVQPLYVVFVRVSVQRFVRVAKFGRGRLLGVILVVIIVQRGLRLTKQSVLIIL